MHAIVDSEGKIALGPEFGAKPGDEVVLEQRGDEWVIKVAGPQMGLCRKGSILVHYGTSSEPVEDALEKDRNERMDQLSEGLPQ
jgi:bifunctional DNA-binding transcriptional regulator/antitoxin component of YhaV-PrlF toxin-antitoxin module